MKIVIDITPEEIHLFMKKEPNKQGSDTVNGEAKIAKLIELLFEKGVISETEVEGIIQGNLATAIGIGVKSWLEEKYKS